MIRLLITRVAAVLLLFTGVSTGMASEHPISITETHVFVARTSARLRVKLFAEDLFLFHNLEPNDIGMLSPEQLKIGLKKHRQFLLDKITLRDAKGDAVCKVQQQ